MIKRIILLMVPFLITATFLFIQIKRINYTNPDKKVPCLTLKDYNWEYMTYYSNRFSKLTLKVKNESGQPIKQIKFKLKILKYTPKQAPDCTRFDLVYERTIQRDLLFEMEDEYSIELSEVYSEVFDFKLIENSFKIIIDCYES